MKSEKETREEIEFIKKNARGEADCCIETLEWVLEGEPRYSVAELEKIFSTKEFYKWRGNKEDEEGDLFLPVKTCLEFLTDQKKVQEVLG